MDQQATFTVSVKSATGGPLTLTPDGGALPDETVGTAVADTVTVISGGKSPYTFEITDGATPDGTELFSEDNADGTTTLTIEGTPTTEGDSSFTVDVVDADGKTASMKASVTSSAKKQQPAKTPVSGKKK